MSARLATGLLALCVGATACSGGSGGEVTAPTLPPITEAPSPSPTAEPVPSEATEATPEGAAEFVRFFYSQIAKGFQTADPTLVADLSADQCATCDQYIQSISTVQQEGWRAEGGDFEILFAVAPQGSGDTARVDVGWSFSPVTYFDAMENIVEEGPAVIGVEENVVLRREAETWVVVEVTRIRQRP